MKTLRSIVCLLQIVCGTGLFAQGTGGQPVRYQAQHTQLYFDDVEILAPSVGPGFALDSAGAITPSPSEVVSGNRSIKGAYSGSLSYTPYLRTLPGKIPFSPGQTYEVSFRYRILATPDRGFDVLFFSPTGANAGSFLPSVTVQGSAGTSGTATLTNTLGSHADYEARWNIVGTGAISIDEIRIVRLPSRELVVSENAELQLPTLGAGLQLLNGASVSSDSSQTIAGKASVRMSNFGTVATNPAFLPLPGDATYIVEFQYRILKYGSNDAVLWLWLQPVGTTATDLAVSVQPLLKNAPGAGVFSGGAKTGKGTSYVLNIAALDASDVVIDNITLLRQDTSQTADPPAAWTKLDRMPYPRLGNCMQGTTVAHAQTGGLAEYVPYQYSLDQIESRLAFADVIAELEPITQTSFPDAVRRLRKLNPNAVILPYRVSQEQQQDSPGPRGGDIDPSYDFLKGLADEWYLRDSLGKYVPDPIWTQIRKMNVSSYCPIENGQTYISYLLNWVNGRVFSSGIWDGIFLDNLFGRVNPHILNANDSALFDADYNRNGAHDETPAAVSEITRTSAVGMLQQLRATNGDLQLIMGNTGPMPELSLAKYVNGYLFECVNFNWNAPYLPNISPAGWRTAFDAYRMMETLSRRPRINLLEGCGRFYAITPGADYSTPTPDDIQNHRFTLGTVLLGDGFYDYDLHGALSAPLWFDEFSVDANGTAVEDRKKKGYLGQALSAATELSTPRSPILLETFDSATIPTSFVAMTGVSISQMPGEVISGGGSLVITNPDHTKNADVRANTNPTIVRLNAPNTYLVAFDWRILETLDRWNGFRVDIVSNSQSLDFYDSPEVIAGDSGTAHFPLRVPNPGPWSIRFGVSGGGGKIAIDNVRVDLGGVGPWRRDFENGFVLVNPLLEPHTFSATDLVGSLNRTGIRRIKGTQAPDLNTGQPVTGALTLGAFDAIILLADHIPAGSGDPAQRIEFTQVTLSSVSATSVAIRWNTNVPTTGRVEYGRTSTGEGNAGETNSSASHRTVLSGLSSATSYVYRVAANDSSGNSATTSLLQFKTASSPPQPASPSVNAIFIAQVVESQALRTNLGVNNLSTSIANVNVTLVDNDGMVLARKSFTVQPDGLRQINSVGRFLYDDHLSNEIYGQLYIESDHPVSAWASQINNQTDDPSVLFSKTSGGTRLLVPSSANTATFRSSLAVMNVGFTVASVDLAAYNTNGSLMGRTATPLSVVPGNVVAFDNVLQSLGISQGFGPIEISSLNGVPLIAVSRVSSLSSTGGFFEAVRDTAATTHQIISHVIDTAELRTNIGINNSSSSEASVTMRLIGADGTELGSLPASVPAHGMTQINQVIRQVLGRSDLTGLQAYITVESTQPVIAWASQIDNATDDPGLAVSQSDGSSHLLVQSAANVGNFRSSLVIVNTGTTTAFVEITSRDVEGNVTARLPDLSIPPQGFFSSQNILERLGVSGNFGPIEIQSTNGQPLVVTSRVYSTSGTSGFFAGQAMNSHEIIGGVGTSYKYFKEAGLSPQTLPPGRSGVGTVRAFGDFSGNGRLDLFAATLTYWPPTTPAASTPSIFEFWRKQSDGSFVKDTQLLTTQNGCIHPRKALVADFNNDSRPDVFVACHGFDAPPFPGEKNKIVLSQSNGTYATSDAASDVGFFHSASAADLNSDGRIDVVVVNNLDPASAFVLLNQGNGIFQRETSSRLPSAINGKPYFSVELLDLNEDGKLDLLLGGHEWDSAQTVALINAGNSDFKSVTPVAIPAVTNEGVVLDFTVTGTASSRALWVLRTSGGDGTFYQSRVIQKVTWPALTSTLPLNQRPAQWFQWLIPTVVNGTPVLTSEDAGVGVSIPQ